MLPALLIDCWGLTTRQPLWVILCRLRKKGRKERDRNCDAGIMNMVNKCRDLQVRIQIGRGMGGRGVRSKPHHFDKNSVLGTVLTLKYSFALSYTAKVSTRSFYNQRTYLKFLDEWRTVKTLIRRRVLRRLIWVFNVCSNLFVLIHNWIILNPLLNNPGSAPDLPVIC